MSFRSNVIANILGQSWGTALAVLMVPLYVRFLGVEAYALIGFSTVAQMWLTLLDAGLSPTFAREAARFRAGEASASDTLTFLYTLERVFAVMAAAVLLAGWLVSDSAASGWFTSERIAPSSIAICITLMAATAGVRWLAALYRGGVIGMERLVWLNWFSVAISTARFGGVVPLIALYPKVELFFAFQLATTIVEAVVLRWYCVRLVAPGASGTIPGFSWSAIGRHGRLASSLAFTSAVWVFVTQSDKLLLSRLLTLQNYGYFTLAVLVASGISMIAFALHQACQSRLNFLAARSSSTPEDLPAFYHFASQLTIVSVLPAGLVMALWPYSVLFAWTGDAAISTASGPLLPFYALGNVALAVMSLPYFLQVARGFMRLHVIGNVLFGLVLIPLVYIVASRYGAYGASLLWFAVNSLFLLFWPILVHRYLLPGASLRWYFKDLLSPSAAMVCAAIALNALLPDDVGAGRWMSLVRCLLAGTVCLAAGMLAAAGVRAHVLALLRRLSGAHAAERAGQR